MRRSHWGFTTTAAVLFCFSALMLTGCKTGSGYKLTDWGWGKSKAADTAIAASSATAGLPAPPSSTATPNGVPSYSGNTGTAGQSTAWNGVPSQGTPASAGASRMATGDYAGTSGAARGFYNQEYQPTGQTGASGYKQPLSTGQTAGGYAGPTAGNTYQVPAQPVSTAGRSVAGDAYSTYGNTGTHGAQALAPYTPAAPASQTGSAYGAGGYGSTPANAYSAPTNTAQNTSSSAPAAGGSIYNQGYGQENALTSTAQASVEPYRPGSTDRATEYSDRVTAPGSVDAQPAAFADGGNTPNSGYPATTAPSTTYGGGTNSVPYTAAGTDATPSYPSTFQR